MAKKQIATFLGPQLGLSTTRGYCYAYSGQVIVETATTLLNFPTGSKLAICDFQFSLGEDTTDNIVWEILLNGQLVSGSLNESGQAGNPLEPLKITLPPFTTVLVRATNFTGTPTGRKCYAIVQGRLY
jgi:hypothetical protein